MKHRFIIAVVMIFSLLVTQAAVAAHPCPKIAKAILENLPSEQYEVSSSEDITAMPCHGYQVSTAEKILCKEHCTQDHRIANDTSVKISLDFIPAYEITLLPVSGLSSTFLAPAPLALPADLRHLITLPPLLAFGQLRI